MCTNGRNIQIRIFAEHVIHNISNLKLITAFTLYDITYSGQDFITTWIDSDEICDFNITYDHAEVTEMEFVRYHRERLEITERITNYFLLIKIAYYTFHLPVDIRETDNRQYLGSISKIPAEKTRKTNIKLNRQSYY